MRGIGSSGSEIEARKRILGSRPRLKPTDEDRVTRATLFQTRAHVVRLRRVAVVLQAVLEFAVVPGRPYCEHAARSERASDHC